ncbi:hypothetical protein COO91_08279 [Nostoc flagelliforme CCNUN1]|uniref:Uncharacterized protein n=1 Tax=Nostoc flagelliforme CCNUN1 TaxID=2038116 RepID=A0A2K8T391_9NOSO|nr:hypothetical protein COO91_08279 [Nostoc flagelliforme CCNUN1]
MEQLGCLSHTSLTHDQDCDPLTALRLRTAKFLVKPDIKSR